MAGLAIETQILCVFRNSEHAVSWKVNRIVQAHDMSAGFQKRGFSGRSQQAALFIYRGTWPNRMAAEARDNSEGTLRDDIWFKVLGFGQGSTVTMPYAIKEAISQDIVWASTSAKEAEQDADIEKGQEEEGGCIPSPNKKKNGTGSKSESKTDAKQDKDTKKRTPNKDI